MTAGLLQHLRPDNVVFLVKPGFQLNQHRHLLAILRRLGQRGDDRGIPADTVQRLLDCKDIGILCGALDKLHHRVKALVRVMQKNVSLPDIRKDIVVIHQFRNRRRGVFRNLVLFESLQTVQLHQERQIQRSRDVENILFPDAEFRLQNFQQPLVDLILHLQADDLAPLALFQLFLDFLQKIRRILLVDGQIRVSHDTVRMGTDNVVAEEQLSDIPLNNFFQQDHGDSLPFRRRKRNKARKHRGNLHGCKFQLDLCLFGIFVRSFFSLFLCHTFFRFRA